MKTKRLVRCAADLCTADLCLCFHICNKLLMMQLISYCDVKRCAKVYKIKWHQESIIYNVTYLNSYFFQLANSVKFYCVLTFLAHLSRRLRGELIVYRSSRRPLVRACVGASVHTFKHEYLSNQLADWNEILSEASLGWGKGFSRF